MTVTGSCLCKKVSFRAATAPIRTRACWCRLCQHIGGGSATVNAAFLKSDLVIEGETTDYVSIADSGSVMHRRFCPTCGVPMFSEAEARPHLIFVRVGVFDDPEMARPAATIWVAEAPSWACIDPTIPRFDGQAPPAG
jgi:hypothetical protein